MKTAIITGSAGLIGAEAIWERIHDEELLPYHLWLEKRIDR
jgi:hypothetical protein